MARIVVGVDGSEGSIEALRWALAEAPVRGATVEVVYAWSFPALTMLPVAPTPPTRHDLRNAGAEVVEKALREAGPATVEIQRTVEEGQPAETLIRRAQDADLLVVGARGLGGFRGLLIGSVSQQCVHHAPCPVVVVRADPVSTAG